ncbi:MAG: LysR family transcriptional regulator [Pseudorhodoplanes sp.]
MDFRELRYFSFVAELKSFSRAAAQLRIAQPALSRCVRQLEEELGVTLFDRHGRGVTLTEAGQTLYERAQTLLQGLRQARDDVATTSAVPRGSLRLAVPPAAGQVLAPSLIERYHALYPQVSIHIHEGFSGYMNEWLAAGRVDVAVMHNPVAANNIDIHHLLDEYMSVIIPGPVAEGRKRWHYKESYTIAELANLPLILPSRPHSLRMLLEQVAADQGISLNIVLEADGLPTIKSLVARGLGATLFTYVAVTNEVAAGTLTAVRIEPPGIRWRLDIASRRDRRKTLAVREIIRMIDEEVHELVRRGIWQGSPELD